MKKKVELRKKGTREKPSKDGTRALGKLLTRRGAPGTMRQFTETFRPRPASLSGATQ